MNFHIYNVVCSIIAIFVYISFRFSVDAYLRVKKNSKSFIKKNKKGFVNYWTYKRIHNEIGLGRIYYLNIILLTLTLLYLFTSTCMGWVQLFSLPISICNFLLCIVQIPAIIFSDIYWNLENYGKRFVFLAKNKSGRGFHSSFYAFIEVLGLLAFAVYNISIAV